MSLTIKFDPSQLVRELNKIGDKAKASVFVGAQAAAQTFYDEARQRVPVNTGKLRDAIYQVRSKDNSTDSRAVYHVSWNRRKAPHGHLVEFGTARAAANPFLRPAYEAVKQQAADAAMTAFRKDFSSK